jgi:DNA-binding transcriptional LysR family regulator
MDFRRLEAFCKVYDLKSFSKAGQELFLSQPTISAHVSSLEQDLGVRLFDRLGRVVLPTPAGEILYRHAQEAFASLATARAEIEYLQDRVAGDLIVAGSTIPAHYLLPQLLSRFARKYPEVKIQLRVGDSRSVARQVSRGELLVGVVGAQEDFPDLVYERVLEDDLVIVAAPDMCPAGGHLLPEDLASHSWVMREVGSGTRKAFEQGVSAMGVELRTLSVAVTVESTQAVLQCVLAGLGLSCTSRLAAGSLLDRGELVEVKTPGLSLPRAFYSVHHERRHTFPVVHHFLQYLAQESSSAVKAAA